MMTSPLQKDNILRIANHRLEFIIQLVYTLIFPFLSVVLNYLLQQVFVSLSLAAKSG
jgi:hypothetical protein